MVLYKSLRVRLGSEEMMMVVMVVTGALWSHHLALEVSVAEGTILVMVVVLAADANCCLLQLEQHLTQVRGVP